MGYRNPFLLNGGRQSTFLRTNTRLSSSKNEKTNYVFKKFYFGINLISSKNFKSKS
jgi:hypothetical protein